MALTAKANAKATTEATTKARDVRADTGAPNLPNPHASVLLKSLESGGEHLCDAVHHSKKRIGLCLLGPKTPY